MLVNIMTVAFELITFNFDKGHDCSLHLTRKITWERMCTTFEQNVNGVLHDSFSISHMEADWHIAISSASINTESVLCVFSIIYNVFV